VEGFFCDLRVDGVLGSSSWQKGLDSYVALATMVT
jgi:hypothetical protein